MRNIILLGALVMFAFTASAQTEAPACNGKEKTEKVCAKTGKKCDETCENKKTGTCCESKKDGDKKSCSKEGDKKACCSKEGKNKSCSKDGGAEKGEKTKGEKRTRTKDVGMSK